MDLWLWLGLGALAAVAAFQQVLLSRARHSSKKREELFQIITENAADMIALVDGKGRRIYNSPAYKRILGYSPLELGETSSFEQIHVDDRFKVLAAAREAGETGIGRKLEYRFRHKDGSWRNVESIANTIRNPQGQVDRMVIVTRDITDRKRAEEQLAHNSFHDALTGLPNRRLFLDRLQHFFARAQRHPGSQYAVLFVDLDGFKALNQDLGTEKADLVIVETGRRLDACLRNDDALARPQARSDPGEAVLSRMGGDEFTILLDQIDDPSDALRVAERIQAAVREPFTVEARELRLSASIGIALSTPVQTQAEELLQDADVAMRRAKSLGGSRSELFDEAMHTHAVKRLQLENELRTAIAERQFCVYYLPLVRLETRRVIGFEALLRWRHPQQGLVAADKFLEAAEDTGLLVRIGQWLVHEACQQLRHWQHFDSPAAPVRMTVNISARQLADAELVPGIQQAVRRIGIDPSHLSLEITEKAASADPKLTASVLAQLKQLGTGRILDNFGSGNFSLHSLRSFSVDSLKIDRSLIHETLADRSAADIVEAVILLAKKMNLRVIAEGIETAKQLEHLRELGCELGQGYLFSPPVDADAATKLLQQQSLAHASAAGAG